VRFDSCRHRRQVVQNLLVREPQDNKASCLQLGLAIGVLQRLNLVDRPVYLDHQGCFCTIEIDQEAADSVLAAKLGSRQTSIA
jgi:hypothetical protein